MATQFSIPTRGSQLSRAVDKLRPYAAFFAEFVRRPAMVGSGVPSTRHMVNVLLDKVDWPALQCLVEYGPGIGSFTREALRRMRPDAQLIAIDTSASFIAHLKKSIADSRLHAVHGSAGNVRSVLFNYGINAADCVLSGLPFSTLDRSTGKSIVRETALALSAPGQFLVYQMSAAVRPMLDAEFERIEEVRVWMNIPPCRLYHASGVRLQR